MSKRISFDAEAARQLLGFIRAGGYPHVAAEAAGVPAAVFRHWLELGERPGAHDPYRRFVREVRQAAAAARLVVEHGVYKKDPKFWLAHGPGKETPGNPGWTGEVRPLGLEQGSAAPGQDEWRRACEDLLQALVEYPEARAAAARALARE